MPLKPYRRGGAPRLRTLLAVAWVVAPATLARSASASTLEIRCPALSAAAQEELRARSALLLYSAGMDKATLALECDANGAVLVWIDGSKTAIKGVSGWVEGTLDAIEDNLARTRGEGAPRQPSASPTPLPAPSLGPEPPNSAPKPASSQPSAATPVPSGTPLPDSSPRARPGSPSLPVAPAEMRARPKLDGGIGVRLITEVWSGPLGIGPQVDVGIGPHGRFAFVLSEGARFAHDASQDPIMLFDMQLGVSYGAPYKISNGFGVALFSGAERVAAGRGGGASWQWNATATLGVCASVDLGFLNIWLGADARLRSNRFQNSGGDTGAIPSVTGMFHVGLFFPAFTSR